MVTDGIAYLPLPDKSENDKKLYKLIKLPNGLRALLVSDPSPVPHDGLTSSSSSYDSTGDSVAEETSTEEETGSSVASSDSTDDSDYEEGDEKLAACAVLVDVGSFSEPNKYPGLAHFLEHMIFMGSEQFPAENAFDAHIKKCGGFDNANTDGEETVFYFEVSEKHLDSSIEIFTALLKKPLMKKDGMTREREAVESEFQQTLLNDEARRDQLLASLASEGFPHGAFTWGNKQTLQEGVDDDDLHKTLHEFCARHYSAHRMIACVQARLPIDELQMMVTKHFSGIPNNCLDPIDFKPFSYEKAFKPEFHNQMFFLKPVENVSKVELTWVLPPMMQHYKCKPDQFVAYLMGYEGEGSLCAYLRKKLWALELIAGTNETGFDNNTMYTLFNICLYLTDEGHKHLDEVLAATFAYIKLFNSCADLKTLYEELQAMEQINFRFLPQKAAYDNVQNLVMNAKWYAPKDILTGTDIYFEYNEELIRQVIRHLNEFSFNIMLTVEKHEGITFDQKEKWFGTDYAQSPIPQKIVDLWQNSQPVPELSWPKPNKFISTDFKLFWHEDGKPDLPKVPKKIWQTDICELWFRQDDIFELPDGYMYFYLISPLLRQNVKNDVMCAIYAALIKFHLSEELYPATAAGFTYQIYSAEKGLVVKVNGFNEKLHLLMDSIGKALVSIRDYINADQVEILKKNQKKAYFNDLIKPRKLNRDIHLCIVENIRWPMIEKYKIIDEITYDDMLEFAGKFPEELYIQALMQGNLTQETAHNVMNTLVSRLGCQSIKEEKYVENRTVQLPQGSHYIKCHALNDMDPNTFICNIYQIGPSTVRIESILDLLMMFVDEPLFDTLRTKEQLGYYVGAASRSNYGIANYSICVNSQESKFTAAHVEERIEVFREKMLEILDEMSAEDYNQVRESLIKIKQVLDMSLDDEVTRNWTEISCEEYLFDRRRKEIEVLRSLEKQEIIDFCLNNERTNLRKLSVQVIGHVKSGAPTTEVTKEAATTDDSDTNDEEENKDELYEHLAANLNVKFIPKEGDATVIVDINDFKENLHVYPITKTKLEDKETGRGDGASSNERPASGADIIEEVERH